MKSTVVDESLSTTTTRVLFQRESTYYFMIQQQNEKSTHNIINDYAQYHNFYSTYILFPPCYKYNCY